MIQWSFGLTSATIQMTLVREGAAGIRYHFQIMIIDCTFFSVSNTVFQQSCLSSVVTFCLFHILPDLISVMTILLWRNGLELFLFVCIFVSSSLQAFPSTSSRTCMINNHVHQGVNTFQGPKCKFLCHSMINLQFSTSWRSTLKCYMKYKFVVLSFIPQVCVITWLRPTKIIQLTFKTFHIFSLNVQIYS